MHVELAEQWREGFFARRPARPSRARREAAAPDILPGRRLQRLRRSHLAERHTGVRGTWLATARPMQPLPAHRSSTRQSAPESSAVRRPALHQHLGVGARDEHVRRDIQRQAVKLPLADEIGHRLARQHAAHTAAIRRALDLAARRRAARRAEADFPAFARRSADQLAAPPASRPPRLGLAAGACAGPDRGRSYLLRHLRLSTLPFCSGNDQLQRAGWRPRACESSGSLVVKFCSHMPGRLPARSSRDCRARRRSG